MKTILLPLDFYKDSRQAIKAILEMLQGMSEKYKLLLLKTYQVPVSSPDQVIPTHDELRSQSLGRLQKELHAAQELLTNDSVFFEIVSQMGAPMNVVSRIIKERGIDCVVIGKDEKMITDSKQDELVNLLNRVHCTIIILPVQI